MTEWARERDPLEVLADEFAARCRQGESPSIAAYAGRHPRYASQIRELFPAVAMLEQLRRDEQGRRAAAALRNSGAHPPQRLGDFVIVREIGRGGMGIVYEARQQSLARRVAVKVLPKHVLLLDKHLQRFQREAQTAARLRHTNIVPVFGVGEQDGLHYYVMPLIRGVGLHEVIRALREADGAVRNGAVRPAPGGDVGPWLQSLIARNVPDEGARVPGPVPPSAGTRPVDRFLFAARVGVQAAEALQYAHAQGTLHRDIKPSNLLVDAEGVVCVADFGLARAVDPEGASRSSDVAGTPRYMAPEQLRGTADARSDIYAVGLTLYELLTLRAAFETPAHGGRAADRQLRSEPVPLRRIEKAIPRDLETIVLKCLAHDPAQRYATAGELAWDLQRFLQDRPIRARRASWGEQAYRWARRNPALAAMTGLAAVLMIAVAATAANGYRRTQAACAAASRALAQAERSSRIAREALDDIYGQLSPDRSRLVPSHDVDLGGSESPLGQQRVQVPASPEIAAVLENLLVFYDRLAEEAPTDRRVRGEWAVASRRVGDIRQQLGQLDQAEQEYTRAVARLAALPPRPEEGPLISTELARTHNEIGNVRSARFEFGPAHESHRHALAILQSVETSAASNADYRYELARTLYFLASKRLGPVGTRRPGDTGRTMTGPRPHHYWSYAYRKHAIRLLEDLARDYPDAPDYRYLLGLCHRLSGLGPLAGRTEVTAAGRRRAIEILTELKTRYPAVAVYRYELSVTYAAVPVGLVPGQPDEYPPADAEAGLRSALDESQWLVVRYPTIPEYARTHALTLAKLGMVCWKTGQLAEAEDFFRQALESQEAVLAGSPESPTHHRLVLELMRVRRGQVSWLRVQKQPDGPARTAARERLAASVENLASLAARSELAQDELALALLPDASQSLGLVGTESGLTGPASRAAQPPREPRRKAPAERKDPR